MEKAASPGARVGLDAEQLKARHHEIERQLAELERHLSLSAAEQAECGRLKKEKLWIKDRLAILNGGGKPPLASAK